MLMPLGKRQVVKYYYDCYKNLLYNGVDLGSPLYITSQCLNLLGTDVSKNKFYILDGSRRLVAYTMLNMNPKI